MEEQKSPYVMVFALIVVGSIALICMLGCTGCSGCAAKWWGADTAEDNAKIVEDFAKVPGEENLYYSKETHIVYWIGGSYTVNAVGNDYTTSYMTVWYADNGKPYMYNTDTMMIERME